MRWILMSLSTLVVAAVAPASPVACTSGTVTYYGSLGLAGCTAQVGTYTLTVQFDGATTSTNGASYPSFSDILIDPQFALTPTGFQESFALSLVPGSWIGTPGQSLDFGASFYTSISGAAAASVSDQASVVQSGSVTAEICISSHGYSFGFICNGEEYSTTFVGTTSNVAAAPGASFSGFGISPGFSGVLPNGTFDGLTTTANVTLTPEPATGLFCFFALMVGIGLFRQCRNKSCAVSTQIRVN